MNGPGREGEVPTVGCYQTVVVSSATLLRSVHAPGIPNISQITFMCPVGKKGKEDCWQARQSYVVEYVVVSGTGCVYNGCIAV